MATVSVIVVALGASADAVARALESTGSEDEQEILLLGDLSLPGMERAIGPHRSGLRVIDCADLSPSEARNRAVSEATGRYLVLIDPGERLAAGALARHVSALEASPETGVSYGRTAVQDGDHVRLRPEHGRGGVVLKRLVKDKHMLASAACAVWRGEALGSDPFRELTTSPALRLALALDLTSRGVAFAFQPEVVAERGAERLDLKSLEELVKIFVGMLYSADPLPEKLEQRVRFRLARHLVAIGKHHYRGEDFQKAGSFFDEAVKAVPAYFKGRRYQFLNFLKRKVTGRGD